MRVYRLEEDGYGIFNGDSRALITYPKDSIYGNMGNSVRQVNVMDDKFRFACTTIDRLIEYFGSDFAPLLDEEGVEIVEYQVSKKDVFVGFKRQEVAFLAENADRLVIKQGGVPME